MNTWYGYTDCINMQTGHNLRLILLQLPDLICPQRHVCKTCAIIRLMRYSLTHHSDHCWSMKSSDDQHDVMSIMFKWTACISACDWWITTRTLQSCSVHHQLCSSLWHAGHQPLCQILIDRGPFLPYLSSVMIKILEQIKIWADAWFKMLVWWSPNLIITFVSGHYVTKMLENIKILTKMLWHQWIAGLWRCF